MNNRDDLIFAGACFGFILGIVCGIAGIYYSNNYRTMNERNAADLLASCNVKNKATLTVAYVPDLADEFSVLSYGFPYEPEDDKNADEAYKVILVKNEPIYKAYLRALSRVSK